ncbi:hypothetical protein RND81_02G061900 [Saponaria officinalis]|uniref:Uncharacterized protein n=1 Tax=Saponaria officinalis TaxID=3572 RepID=A0AAW1MT21_SAPOF
MGRASSIYTSFLEQNTLLNFPITITKAHNHCIWLSAPSCSSVIVGMSRMSCRWCCRNCEVATTKLGLICCTRCGAVLGDDDSVGTKTIAGNACVKKETENAVVHEDNSATTNTIAGNASLKDGISVHGEAVIVMT